MVKNQNSYTFRVLGYFHVDLQDLMVRAAKRLEMRRMIGLIIVTVLALSGCHGNLLLADMHPELNRQFRLGIDTPGEYPY